MQIINVTSTNRYVLRRLWSWFNWYTIKTKEGNLYGERFLCKRITDDYGLSTIDKPPRDTIFRMYDMKVCVICGASSITDEHIISKKRCNYDRNIYDDANNKANFCNHCNPSKQDKSLLEWWNHKERRIDELALINKDLLSATIRLENIFLKRQNRIDDEAPQYLTNIFGEIVNTIPEEYLKSFFTVYQGDLNGN